MSMEQADRAQLKVVTTDQAPGLTSNLEAHRTLGMSPVSLCLSKPSQPAGRLKDVRGMLLCSLVACRYTFFFEVNPMTPWFRASVYTLVPGSPDEAPEQTLQGERTNGGAEVDR